MCLSPLLLVAMFQDLSLMPLHLKCQSPVGRIAKVQGILKNVEYCMYDYVKGFVCH